MENPLKRERLNAALTLAQLADRLDVSKQFIIRAEQGCYVAPPEILVGYFVERRDVNAGELEQDYYKFQHYKRRESFGRLITTWTFPKTDKHPFTYWRECSGIKSEAGACVLFCLHPAVMFKYERGKMLSTPEQLTLALLESGYDPVLVDKLEESYLSFKTVEKLEVVMGDSQREAI